MSLLLDIIFPTTDLSFFDSIPTQSLKHPANLDGLVSLFKYRGPVKQSLADLKFNFVSEMVPRLAQIMATRICSDFPNLINYWQTNNFVLVPIPLHQFRQNWRGFNQSELLCQSLAPLLKLDTQNILFRTKNTVPQSKIKNKKLRKTNLDSSFKLSQEINNNLNIILVDDVYTTGSTLTAAATTILSSPLVKEGQGRLISLWGLTIAG